MIQAAAAGVVDFARADPRDRLWWTRLNMLLDQVEDRSLREVHTLNHRTTTALLGRSDLTDRSIDSMRDNAEKLATQVKRTLFPWVEFDSETATRKAVDKMYKMWVDEWGDPESPETQAKIDATVAMMERQLAASRRAA